MVARRTRFVVTSALLVALLGASAWVTVPLGPVPATLQTLAVMVIALVCPPAQAAATTAVYLLLGAVGAPVFSSATGGLVALAGPTGGYLVGFAVGAPGGAAARTALGPGPRAGSAPLAADVAAIAVTLAIVYGLGAAWLAVSTGRTLGEALAVGVLPFVALDAAKGAAAVVAARALRRAHLA